MNKITCVICFLFSVNVLFSQISYGFRIGQSFNTFKNEVFIPRGFTSFEPLPIDYDFSLNASAYLNLPLTSKLSLQFEVLYIQKGGSISNENSLPFPNSTDSIPRTVYNMNVLEFPILLKIPIIRSKLKVNTLIGFSYGYAMNHRLKGRDICMHLPSYIVCIIPRQDGKWRPISVSSTKIFRHDFSYSIGFSLEEKFNTNVLSLDVRYLHDFSIWQLIDNSEQESPQIYHRNLLLTLGIAF